MEIRQSWCMTTLSVCQPNLYCWTPVACASSPAGPPTSTAAIHSIPRKTDIALNGRQLWNENMAASDTEVRPSFDEFPIRSPTEGLAVLRVGSSPVAARRQGKWPDFYGMFVLFPSPTRNCSDASRRVFSCAGKTRTFRPLVERLGETGKERQGALGPINGNIPREPSTDLRIQQVESSMLEPFFVSCSPCPFDLEAVRSEQCHPIDMRAKVKRARPCRMPRTEHHVRRGTKCYPGISNFHANTTTLSD